MNLIFLIVGLLAAIVGFLACAVMHVHARHDPFPGVNRMPLTKWAGNFFIGSAILLVDCAMGARAPLPIVATFEGSIGLGAAAFCWLLVCASGFAVANAMEVSRRRREESAARARFPFRVIGSMLLLGVLAVQSGCSSDPQVQAYQSRQTYVQTLTAIDELAVAGKLKPADAKTIQLLRPLGDTAEAVLVAAAPGTPAFQTALTAFQNVVQQFLAAKIAAGGK